MAADFAASLQTWSATYGSNVPTGSYSVVKLYQNLQVLQAVLRLEAASRGTIASATTTDLSTKEEGKLDVSGTTTITGLGTVSAGISKELRFTGALTLTHNATSLILPGGANITTANGDTCKVESLGSGNWVCLYYSKKSGEQVVPFAQQFQDGSVSAPSITFSSDTNTGLYRIGADNLGVTLGGTKYRDWSSTAFKEWGNVRHYYTYQGVDYEVFSLMFSGSTQLKGSPAPSGTAGSLFVTGGDGMLGGSAAGGPLYLIGGTAIIGAGGDVDIAGGTGNPTTSTGKISLRASRAAIAGGLALQIEQVGIAIHEHLVVDDLVVIPTIASGGGSGVAIVGNDTCMEVTFGTGSPTSVTINFYMAYANAPMVILSGTQSGQDLHYASSTTQLQILSDTAFSPGTKVSALIIGHQ